MQLVVLCKIKLMLSKLAKHLESTRDGWIRSLQKESSQYDQVKMQLKMLIQVGYFE